MTLFLNILLGIFGCSTLSIAQTNLKLQVENIDAVKGKLYIAIYNKDDGFRQPEYAYTHRIINVNQSPLITVFEDLPEGEYAITLFQDLNDNAKLDVNWAGIPKEPYGFSSNPKLRFGPPSFEDTRIQLNAEIQKVVIQMK